MNKYLIMKVVQYVTYFLLASGVILLAILPYLYHTALKEVEAEYFDYVQITNGEIKSLEESLDSTEVKLSALEKEHETKRKVIKELTNDKKILNDKIEELENEINNLKKNDAVSETPKETSASQPNGHSVGQFRVSAYGADCEGCQGLTANGQPYQRGVTIAADPSILPLGTEVYLEFPTNPSYSGNYIVQDTGSAIKGNTIDLFIGTEAESYIFGVHTANVYIK